MYIINNLSTNYLSIPKNVPRDSNWMVIDKSKFPKNKSIQQHNANKIQQIEANELECDKVVGNGSFRSWVSLL